MACMKKMGCKDWLRKGDLACRKCPQAKDPEPPEEPVLAGDDEEDNEDPEPDNGEEDDEECVISMREALYDADDDLGEALDYLDAAALYADGPAKDAIKEAGSLLTKARKLIEPFTDD